MGSLAGAILLVLAPLLAVIDWWAIWRGRVKLDYLAKPAVMLALVGALSLLTRGEGAGLRAAIQVGLMLSLAGDVFLMLPRERFLAGLVAFLLAHLAYTAGLVPPRLTASLSGLVILALVAAVGAWLVRRIREGVFATRQEHLWTPLLVYSLVISLMWAAALLTWTRTDWSWQAAALVSLGASLFYASDALLAWNRFVRPLGRGRLKVRVLYHTGQISLTVGVIAHLLAS